MMNGMIDEVGYEASDDFLAAAMAYPLDDNEPQQDQVDGPDFWGEDIDIGYPRGGEEDFEDEAGNGELIHEQEEEGEEEDDHRVTQDEEDRHERFPTEVSASMTPQIDIETNSPSSNQQSGLRPVSFFLPLPENSPSPSPPPTSLRP